MVTDKFELKDLSQDIPAALGEIERAAEFCKLSPEQVNVMRLLGEEMMSMTREILKGCSAELWMENQKNRFEIHLSAKAMVDADAKKTFIDLSSARKNTLPRGLKAKIAMLFENFLFSDNQAALIMPSMQYGFAGELPGTTAGAVWSMRNFNRNAPAEERDAALEGAEKSILERFADDILVTVRLSEVELVCVKEF